MGYAFTDEEFAKVFERFKKLADKKKHIGDADLETIASDEIGQLREVFTLDGLQVACGTIGMPTATVRLRGPDGQSHVEAAVGTGPVDAIYKAIDGIIQVEAKLLEFSVHAVTEGIDAIGEVTVRVEANRVLQAMDAQKETSVPRSFGGYGADMDIIVASAKAYLAALNKILVESKQYPVDAKEQPSTESSSALPEVKA
jgi:2-isopropylmalate synthase